MRITELGGHTGETVTVTGWLIHYRSSGQIGFLVVRDGTGVVQAVARGSDWAARLADLGQETSLAVTGRVRSDARSPGGVELDLDAIEVLGASHNYPIAPKEHGVDFLLAHRHLWVRSPRQAAILRLRAAIVRHLRGFLDGHGFVAADPPILTPAAAEGTTSLFAVDYFGQAAYLSQSGQLYMEALAMALSRVYAFGPTFRAEKSKTRRHLTEFWMLEPEIAFCDFEDNLRWQEELIAATVAGVLSDAAQDLAVLGRDLAVLKRVEAPFERMTYDEALKHLGRKGFQLNWGEDFGAPHESALADLADKPVFVTHFPSALKAFYMKPDPTRPEVALAADLLAPEGYGEIIGGSQRIDDVGLLEERLRNEHLDPETYRWYVDLRRYGSVPHSGFGVGIERLTAWIGGLEHVRETIPFPRTLNRIWP